MVCPANLTVFEIQFLKYALTCSSVCSIWNYSSNDTLNVGSELFTCTCGYPVCHAQQDPLAVISISSKIKNIDCCSEFFTRVFCSTCLILWSSLSCVWNTISVSLLGKFPCQHQLPRQAHELVQHKQLYIHSSWVNPYWHAKQTEIGRKIEAIASTIKLNLQVLFWINKCFVLAFSSFNVIYLKLLSVASLSKQNICKSTVTSSSKKSHRHYNDPKVNVRLLTNL